METNWWWLALCLLFALAFLKCMLAGRARRQTLHDSIADLIERGVAVEAARRHLYLSRGTGRWTILDFGADDNGYGEEDFADRDEAIRRFVEVADLD